jgi:hypothetical protein
MSHRRPDPRQAGLEQALRHALRLAVDSVDPAADGLDRIHAKIRARPRAVRTGWPATRVTGLLAVLSTVWRFGEPAAIWLRYWTGAVTERFRPDLGRAGWLGWLRPAAAVATGLLVVTGVSWAIAALPQVSSAGDSHNYTGPGSSSRTAPAHQSSQGGGGSRSPGTGHSSSAQASRTCPASSTAPARPASSSPARSPRPSSSPSPSPSPTPSSSSSTQSGSPTPTGSPTGSPAANVQLSGQAMQSATIATRPLYLTTKVNAKPSPRASRKNSPCA